MFFCPFIFVGCQWVSATFYPLTPTNYNDLLTIYQEKNEKK